MADESPPAPTSDAAVDRPRPWVVVGVDASPSGRLAVRWAWHYVSALSGTLLACTAVAGSATILEGPPERVTALEERTGDELAAARDRTRQILGEEVGEYSPDQVVEMTKVGGVADVLVAAAEGADLLVIGTTPRGRLGRALLGTIRPGVLGSTRCPVVLVPATDPPG